MCVCVCVCVCVYICIPFWTAHPSPHILSRRGSSATRATATWPQ